MTTMREQIMDEVATDLASFADTHSRVEIERSEAIWNRHSTTHHATFLQGSGAYPDVQLNGTKQTYAAFLASPEMAHLHALADSIRFDLGQKQDRYIEPRAKRDGQPDDRPIEGVITDLVGHPPHGATRVLFLRGAAGAGKTVTLRQLARRQAEAYLKGDAEFVYLYIDAQARYLARLDDAVALVLQDLNARFTYRALATLTRHRLVVPIIDGFDELLGAGGGGETVGALTQFLGRLEGRGVTIVSARSTYFDFTNIRASADRLQSGEASFEITPVDLQPWTEKEMCDYLRRGDQYRDVGEGTPEAALATLQRTFSTNETASLFSTPFFLAAAIAVANERVESEEAVRPIRRIIERFLRREVGKFLNFKDEPILSEDDHWRFLGMLAEEMWWQERRELDRGSLDAVAELFAESIGMSESDLRVFTAGASSYAFLANRRPRAAGPPMLAFSHEYYYAFFVARFLARGLAEEEEVARLLGRSHVSPTVGGEFGAYLQEEPELRSRVLSALSSRRVPVPTRETNRGNAGALYEAILSTCDGVSSLNMREASFTGTNFSGTRLQGVQVARCDFVDVDFSDAVWSFAESADSTFTRITVDPDRTRLDGLRVEPGNTLYGISQSSGRMEYDPAKAERICEKVGIRVPQGPVPEAPGYSDHAEATIRLLHKLLRIAERMYYLSDDILAQRGVSNDPCWGDLDRLLESHGLVELKVAQRRGPEGRLRRLTFPPNVIAEGEGMPANNVIRTFWKDVRRL